MKITSVSQARAELSELIAEVRRGDTVVITHRGTPVARIEPFTTADVPDRQRIDSLIARGLLMPAREALDVDEFLSSQRPSLPEDVDASRFIVEERAGSR